MAFTTLDRVHVAVLGEPPACACTLGVTVPESPSRSVRVFEAGEKVILAHVFGWFQPRSRSRNLAIASLTMSRNCRSASWRARPPICCSTSRRSEPLRPLLDTSTARMLGAGLNVPAGISTWAMRWRIVRTLNGANPRLLPPSVSVLSSWLWTSMRRSFASSLTKPLSVVSPCSATPWDHTTVPPSVTITRTVMCRLSLPRTMPSAGGHWSTRAAFASPHAGSSSSIRTRRCPLSLCSARPSDAALNVRSTLTPPEV